MKRTKIIKHLYIIHFMNFLKHCWYFFPDLSSKIIYLLIYFSFKKERSIAVNQLKSCNITDTNTIIKDLIKHLSRIIEDVIFSNIETLDKAKKIAAKNMHIIDTALEKGNGAIILTAHLGNWEYVAQYLCLKGYSMSAIARKNNNFENIIQSIRSNSKINVIYNEDDTWSNAISCLNKNHLLGIVADQYPKRSGIWSEFLKRPSLTAKGAALFSIKSKAPVIPCFMIRKKNSYIFHVCDAIYANNIKGNFTDKVQIITDTYNKIMTEWIMKYPDQWMWFHKRWR